MVVTVNKAARTTMELATYAARTRFEDIPKEVIELAKEAIIDLVGRTLAGNSTFPGKAVVEYVREMESKPESTVMGAKLKVTPQYAAYANAVLGHCLELEDVGKGGSFDATALLCVALALGEKLCSSGRDILTAYVVGHEVQGRVSRACLRATTKRFSLFKFGFLGCATTAARMLNLEADGIATAISLVATQASGIGPTSGTMAHYLDFRSAARSGIESAILARKGITARKDILEAPRCFLDEYVGPGDYDLEQMTRNWGKGEWQAARTQIKKYSACFLTHGPVDTLLALMKENKLSYKDIKSVEMEIGAHPLFWIRFEDPKNEDEAHFSFPHTLGTAILTGRVWLESYTDEAVNDPKYIEARKKVKVIPRLDWPIGREASNAIIHINLVDGRRITRETAPEVIQPGRDEIVRVYKELTQPYLSAKQQKRSLELMSDFDELPDVCELMDIART